MTTSTFEKYAWHIYLRMFIFVFILPPHARWSLPFVRVVCIAIGLFKQIQFRSDIEKPFSFSDLAAFTAKSENGKRLFNAREGSDYPAAWLT